MAESSHLGASTPEAPRSNPLMLEKEARHNEPAEHGVDTASINHCSQPSHTNTDRTVYRIRRKISRFPIQSTARTKTSLNDA